ncbi:MAG TPA: hypothetical protein VEV20_06700, partial [Burkholderiales bacterium]|nr:hypothetical protein [Burkholderiales bacterium]
MAFALPDESRDDRIELQAIFDRRHVSSGQLCYHAIVERLLENREILAHDVQAVPAVHQQPRHL